MVRSLWNATEQADTAVRDWSQKAIGDAILRLNRQVTSKLRLAAAIPPTQPRLFSEEDDFEQAPCPLHIDQAESVVAAAEQALEQAQAEVHGALLNIASLLLQPALKALLEQGKDEWSRSCTCKIPGRGRPRLKKPTSRRSSASSASSWKPSWTTATESRV